MSTFSWLESKRLFVLMKISPMSARNRPVGEYVFVPNYHKYMNIIKTC